MKFRTNLAIVATLALVASLFSAAVGPPLSARAANTADVRFFDPGNIISDALFFDGGAMTSSSVQNFLNGQVPTCRAGYTCLKGYRQDTPTRLAEAGRCMEYTGQAQETAAVIIARVGVACGVSQKALLVLLQKETSLVTDDWPTSAEYRKATGYGCPDTSVCDSTYYGFFNQVYMAALQFKRYAANPTGWNHIAGRVNSVRFHPNSACGSSSVFIQNQATAGLYNYTPYQPNAAALGNLYGTGDGCSSYGNRNFWRLYTDWFGSTTGASSLARTVDNPRVFLMSGTVKYPVTTLALLDGLAPLGTVGFVSQSYLDRFTTAQEAGRVLRTPGGAMYFFGSGYKLPFATCAQVVDYGGQCNPAGYVQVTDAQGAAFRTGPPIGPVMGTTEGPRYFITVGTKREVLDDRSQREAGIAAGYNVLTESALAGLKLASPVTRDGVFVLQRGGAGSHLLSKNLKYPVSVGSAGVVGLPKSAVGSLKPESLAQIPSAATNFLGVVRGPTDTLDQILVAGGRYSWLNGAATGTGSAVIASSEFLNAFPTRGQVVDGALVKSDAGPTVYLVVGTGLRPISSWSALLSFSQGSPNILTVSSDFISRLPKGDSLLPAGTLVRAVADPTVYLVNGLTSKIALSNFDVSTELGVTGVDYVSAELLRGYPATASTLGYGFICGTEKYVSASGSLHAIAPDKVGLYPLEYQSLDSYTCSRLEVGTPAGQFIRVPNGDIFQLVAGQKRHVLTLERYSELGGSKEGFLSVSSGLSGLIPEGPSA